MQREIGPLFYIKFNIRDPIEICSVDIDVCTYGRTNSDIVFAPKGFPPPPAKHDARALLQR
jgi:hypothetical protein